MTASSETVPSDRAGTLLGHPKGLFILFFAEMWERFSYYGMRALLVLYLTKHFLFSDQQSGMIYGAYTSLVYITPVIGGYLADHYLGQRKAVLFGGVMIAIGHALLGIEGTGGQGGFAVNAFWTALAFIIVGTGFLKANISAIVGQLYPRDDVRRDPAYTIFYMGINVGGMLGPIACGILGETVGWSWGFGAAAVGMLAGIVVFVLGKPLLLGRGEPVDPVALRTRAFGPLSREWAIYVVSILSVAGIALLLRHHDAVGWLLAVCGVGAVVYLLWEAVFRLEKDDRDRMLAALFLLALNPLFWALFEQAGASLNLFTDRHVDRTLFGVLLPASVFQSINSIFIILLAPIFATLWVQLGKRGWEPSTPAKFGLGLVQVGLGFLVLVAGARWAGIDNPTPALFIVLLYLLHTTGELCLSPVGLSAMSKLTLPRMAGLIMGVWFLATAAGDYLAGLISANIGAWSEGAADPMQVTISVYRTVGIYAAIAGVVVLLLAPFVKRLMHLERLGKA